jgi:hypothetical protein
MSVQQTHRSVEQVDAGGDDRRAHPVVVEHQQLDQIVDVTLVIRNVDDTVRRGGRLRQLDVFRMSTDLAQDRIERVLQDAIHRVSLGGLELFQVGGDALVGLFGGQPRAAAQVTRHLFSR